MSLLTFHVESFEGPLDLLLHLIQKNKIDIYNIPITEITRQYLEYIELMEKFNIDVAGEFLVMSATLINIKSRLLLPVISETDGEDELTLQDLVNHLLEYQKFKELAIAFEEQVLMQQKCYSHPVEKPSNPTETSPEIRVSLFDLLLSMKKFLAKTGQSDPIKEVILPQVTIEDKIKFIMANVFESKPIEFGTLFHPDEPRIHIIATFLAVLELLQQRKLVVYQVKPFDPLWIQVRTEQV